MVCCAVCGTLDLRLPLRGGCFIFFVWVNRLYLLCQCGIKVFRFVRPRSRSDEQGADDIPRHLFSRESVALIHGDEKKREHERDHQEHGKAVADCGTGEQLGRYADNRRRAEA